MTIHHFAENQNLVFFPALLAALVATVLICLPIIFVQTLRRSGRIVPVTVVAFVLAAGVLVVAGWQGGVGFRTLGDERARVQAELQSTYGLDLSAGDVGELVDGGKVPRTLPALATQLDLKEPTKVTAACPIGCYNLHFAVDDADADTYTLTFGGEPWPKGYRAG